MARIRGVVYRILQARRSFRSQEALAAIVLIQCRIPPAVVAQMNGTVTAVHLNIGTLRASHSHSTISGIRSSRQAVGRQVVVQFHRDGAVVHGGGDIVRIVGVLILCRAAQYADSSSQLGIVGSTAIRFFSSISLEIQALLQSRIAGDAGNHYIRTSRCIIFHLQRHLTVTVYGVFTTISSHQMAVLIQYMGQVNTRNGIAAVFR